MSRTPSTSQFAAHQALRRKKEGGGFDPTERRHPRFNLFEKHWRFLRESYIGGPDFLFKGLNLSQQAGQHNSARAMHDRNLFPYFKEGQDEYRDRLLRAHRNNYSKKVVNQLRSFIARKPPTRKVEDVEEALRLFWKNADGRGRDIDRVMMLVLQWMMVFGVVWVQVDKPREQFDSALQELEEGMPFVKIYFPFDVLDAGFDGMGRLKWVMVREMVRKDDDFRGPADTVMQFIAWDRNGFEIFEQEEKTEDEDASPTFRMVGAGTHGLGFVPFRPVKFTDSEDEFVAPGLIDDIAYLDRDIFNKMSQLDVVIFDQTFSQLAIPADAVVLNAPSRSEGTSTVSGTSAVENSREETRKRILEMGTKRVFLFNGQTNHTPMYISPDASQANLIRQVIRDEIEEIYRIAGLLGEVGREVKTQSGVSKAYDFDRLNKVLTFAAQELQSADEWVAKTVREWLSPVDSVEPVPDLPEDAVNYPDNFDIMGLLELLDIAFRADEFDLWSPTADSMLRANVVSRLFPSATLEQRRKIAAEVEKRREREAEMSDRRPLDPAADPRMIDDDDSDDPRQPEPSQVRGPGGGARRPGAGPPTRPTTQQADAADAGPEA